MSVLSGAHANDISPTDTWHIDTPAPYPADGLKLSAGVATVNGPTDT